MDNDIFKGHGVEITLKNQDDFLKIKETLTRIGIASKKDNILYQSCHIFHKQGRYVIAHFKEMFLVDGKESNFSDEDKGRRNKIVELLKDWGLLTIVNEQKIKEPLASMSHIKILNHKEKNDWILESKYNIGKSKF